MAGPIRDKINLWRDSERGLKSRLNTQVNPPALDRDDVLTSLAQEKLERGDRIQRWRLENYPSIDVNFDTVYAGSIEGTAEDAQELLMDIGFRNGPFAYVEVTDEFGPDDGSYWLHIITETGKFPVIENRLGLFRRIKDQVHVAVWEDQERGLTHLGAHREQSALLQPARHVTLNDSNAQRGVRDLRDKFKDELGEELPQPLNNE